MKKDQPTVEVTDKAPKKPDPKKKPTKIPSRGTTKSELRIMHKRDMIQRRLRYNKDKPLMGAYLQHQGNLSRQHPNKSLPIPACYSKPYTQVTYEQSSQTSPA